MKNKMFKVGAIVPKLKIANVSYNTKEIISIIKANKDCGLLVFPELSLTGYTCGDLFFQQSLLEESLLGLDKIKDCTKTVKDVTVALGLPFLFEDKLYNCAAYCCNGHVIALVPKSNIPSYGEYSETRWFASGEKVIGREVLFGEDIVPFGIDVLVKDELHGVTIGTELGEDLFVPDKPSTHAALAGANVIVNLSASNEVIKKEEYRLESVKHQSENCYCAYIYTSSGMDESSTDLVFSGHTIIAEDGKVLANHIFPERSHVEYAIIDLDKVDYNRMMHNTFLSNDNAWYRLGITTVHPLASRDEITASQLAAALKKENYPVMRMPFVPADDAERERRCARIIQIQAHGLATRVRATNIKTLVLGVSGGLDSTLALLVCNEAKKIVPDIRIIGYTLPSEGNTSDDTKKNAWALMKALKIDARELAIGKEVKDHLVLIGHGPNYLGDSDTTYENAQARMRTYILMDIANMENGLVVGTGDLSELALGWCTYNGDQMSMYGVNASIPKTLVQYLCYNYALTCGDKKLKEVLLRIVDTPISPELTPNQKGKIAQKTEDKIGKYDLNDFFMFYIMRYGLTPDKILGLALTAYPELTKEHIKEAEIRFYKRFFYQQFKRSCSPDGPKVGTITLSPRGDWHMPSDATVDLWLDILKKA